MHFTAAALIASVALVAPTVAAPQSDDPSWPACVDKCASDNPVSSFCDGDETGEDLANCTCASINGSLLHDCLLECTPEEQGAYADRVIKGDCAKTIFPDAVLGDDDSSNNDDADDDADDADETSTTSAGATADPTSSSEEEQATETNADEEEDDGSAAMGLTVPAALAVGGLFVAFLL